MRLARGQMMLIGAVAVFFALQLLPHHFTRLFTGPFGFSYPLLAALVGLAILMSMAVAAVMWLLARDPESRLRRRNWCATFLLMLSIGVALSVASSAYARGLPTGSFVKHFDQRVWAAPASSQFIQGDITDRQKMLGDVIRQVVNGGTKENTIAKLGPSEDDRYFLSSGRDLIYCMGPQRDSAFGIDSEWLLIWFDADGRISRYEIWSD